MSSLIWPAPRMHGRAPIRTHEFEPGAHLGIDIGWCWQTGDPTDAHRRSHHGVGPYVILPDAPWVASADGDVLYAEWRTRGWATRIRTAQFDILYMHGERGTGTTQRGQHVTQGQHMAMIGYDPTDGEGWSHLHFEIRLPVKPGTPGRDGWGCLPVDPWPYVQHAAMIDVG